MSKLSPSLKALVNAPYARPLPPKRTEERMRAVFTAIAADAAKHNVGFKPWVTLASATTFTHNVPEGLTILQDVASTTPSAPLNPVQTAELIREVGLKCISFNGIPRSINLLNAFHDSLPAEITSGLETRASRAPTPENIAEITARGRSLWDSVYRPFEDKLVERLARSHPDLPVHILNSHYAPILSDPAPAERGNLAGTGRILTSLIALACLRAQTGVGPQVLSHVFGLRKAIEDGSYKAEGQEEVVGAEWLAGDEGSEWILRTVDSISEALGPKDLAKGIREGWKEAEKAKL